MQKKEYKITMQAYLKGTKENPYYESLAEMDGKEYAFRFPIKEGVSIYDPELEQCDMCDWKNPQIFLLGNL